MVPPRIVQFSSCTITPDSLGGDDKCQWCIDKGWMFLFVCFSFYPSLVKHWSISRNQTLSWSKLIFHCFVASLQNTLFASTNIYLCPLHNFHCSILIFLFLFWGESGVAVFSLLHLSYLMSLYSGPLLWQVQRFNHTYKCVLPPWKWVLNPKTRIGL